MFGRWLSGRLVRRLAANSLLDRSRRDATRGEVTRVAVRRREHRRDHVLQKLIEHRRRCDGDGCRVADFGPYLVGGGGGVGHADQVRPARRPDQRLRHGAAQRQRDRAFGVVGRDDRLTDEEPVGKLHPDHDEGAVGLVSTVDDEWRREAPTNPLAEQPWVARAVPVRRATWLLQAGAPPTMTGSYSGRPRRRWDGVPSRRARQLRKGRVLRLLPRPCRTTNRRSPVRRPGRRPLAGRPTERVMRRPEHARREWLLPEGVARAGARLSDQAPDNVAVVDPVLRRAPQSRHRALHLAAVEDLDRRRMLPSLDQAPVVPRSSATVVNTPCGRTRLSNWTNHNPSA